MCFIIGILLAVLYVIIYAIIYDILLKIMDDSVFPILIAFAITSLITSGLYDLLSLIFKKV